ncbi:MAG TPA: hypothetical protein DCR12_08325 [Lachnospiraceae bacterium]|nr:hypothetical protein [Lachnospiraceae bacterium]
MTSKKSLKKAMALLFVGVLSLSVFSGCDLSRKNTEKKSQVNETQVPKDIERINVSITQNKIESDEMSKDNTKPYATAYYPSFKVETEGYDRFQERLNKISNDFKVECEKWIEDEIKKNYNGGFSMTIEAIPTIWNSDTYSIRIVETVDLGEDKYENLKGFVINPKTGEDIDITHFVPDRNKLVEMLRQNQKKGEYGVLYNDETEKFFTSLKSNENYHYNYYINGQYLMVIFDGVMELGGDRTMDDIEIAVPMDYVSYGDIQAKDYIDAYINYINNEITSSGLREEDFKYALVYIDDNDVPELLVGGNSTGGSTEICTYAGGLVRSEMQGGCRCEYIPREGLVHYYSFKLNLFDSHTVYEMNANELKYKVSGGSEAKDVSSKQFDSYKLNGKPSSKEEVAKAVSEAFGNSVVVSTTNEIVIKNDKARSFDDEKTYTYKEIIDKLNSMRDYA